MKQYKFVITLKSGDTYTTTAASFKGAFDSLIKARVFYVPVSAVVACKRLPL